MSAEIANENININLTVNELKGMHEVDVNVGASLSEVNDVDDVDDVDDAAVARVDTTLLLPLRLTTREKHKKGIVLRTCVLKFRIGTNARGVEDTE